MSPANENALSHRPAVVTAALAWTQTSILAVCIITAVVIGFTGPLPLALAVAAGGAAVAGGIQVTIHIRH
ncbi:hypothetical protein [Streptomyces sp. NPDC053079]|uniref:hypothetical protein n=1 Tax=Streptomyces sp. NPDC053079 TaxID=3365697 RepID=UPI0037D2FBDF